MIVTEKILNKLVEDAKKSPRLRMNYDLRTTSEDKSQRMMNAIEPGSVIPIHRHRLTTECTAVIRGAVRQNFYDDEGNLIESFEVRVGSPISFYVVPQGVWHNTEALESGTIIFEAKDGAWEPAIPEDFLIR